MSYENLANAIILMAVQDYRNAVRNKYTVGISREQALNDVEQFIRSQWFRELTDLDPEYLLRILHEDRDNPDERRISKRRG